MLEVKCDLAMKLNKTKCNPGIGNRSRFLSKAILWHRGYFYTPRAWNGQIDISRVINTGTGWEMAWLIWSPGGTMRVFACCHNRSIEHLFLPITELIGLNPLLTSPCASIRNHPSPFGNIVKLGSQSFGTRTLLRQKISDIGETHPNNEWLISPEPDYNQPSSTERSRTRAISLKLLLKYLRHSRGQTQPRLMEAFWHGTWSNYFFSRPKKCPHYDKTKLYLGQFRENIFDAMKIFLECQLFCAHPDFIPPGSCVPVSWSQIHPATQLERQ